MQFPKLLVISLAILLMHACKEDSCLQSSDTFISARSEIPDIGFLQKVGQAKKPN